MWSSRRASAKGLACPLLSPHCLCFLDSTGALYWLLTSPHDCPHPAIEKKEVPQLVTGDWLSCGLMCLQFLLPRKAVWEAESQSPAS